LAEARPRQPEQELRVLVLEPVSEIRVNRTVFDYTFKVVLVNDGQPRADVVAMLQSAGLGTTILDGSAATAGIDAGQQLTVADTITLRHDRSTPFDFKALVWNFSSVSAVTIRGVIADSGGIAAPVEIVSLIDGLILATTDSDATGHFVAAPVATSRLFGGYMVRASLEPQRSRPRAQAGSTGAIRFEAIYGNLARAQESHATVLTSVVARAVQSTTFVLAEYAPTASALAANAVTSGLLPAQFQELSVAQQFALSASPEIVIWGLPNYIESIASSMTYSPQSTGGATFCEDITIGAGASSRTVTRCSAEILETGGQVYDQTGNVLVDVPVANPGCRYATVAEISDGGHRVKAWHQQVLTATTCPILPNSNQIFTVHLPPSANAYAGLEPCAVDFFHTAVSQCVTRDAQSNMRPGFFVNRESKVHRVSGPMHEASKLGVAVSITRRYGANLARAPLSAGNSTPVAVLLIHGYTTSFASGIRDNENFGGGFGTWGELPRLIGELQPPAIGGVTGYRVYNFHWRTDTSFRNAARDLADAIELAWKQNGERPVHILAHSFGGLLARTALQGLYGEFQPGQFDGKVASLTTVGTPHSGVSSSATTVNGVSLPKGWDFGISGNVCAQVSCYEAGLGEASIADWYRQSAMAAGVIPGKLIADLNANGQPLTGLPSGLRLLALIGQRTKPLVPFLINIPVYDDGDGLISLDGQRFFPDSQSGGATPRALGFEALLHSEGRLTERLIGYKPSSEVPVGQVAPGKLVRPDLFSDFLAESFSVSNLVPWPQGVGYAHLNALNIFPNLRPFGMAQVAIGLGGCGNGAACEHDTWVNIRDLLLAMHGGTPSSNFPTTTGFQLINVSGASCTTPVAGVPMVCSVSGTNLPSTVSMTATNCTPSPMSVLPSGTGTQRQFTCTPVAAGVLVTVGYAVPGFTGPLLAVPPTVAIQPPTGTHPLNDTGIPATLCYAAGSGALVSCTSPAAIALNDKQDGMVGRDVTDPNPADGKLGFSFSEVPRAGGGFYARTECVKDNVTGLMWEGKTADGGLRDWQRVYSNWGDGRPGDATAYVVSVNATELCGHSDWRLPDRHELQGIVDYEMASHGPPAIDTAWFPNTWSNWTYWSSSPLAGVPDSAWVVNFGRGEVFPFARANISRLRLVR